MRGVDLISAHEAAAHDVHRKGTADKLLHLPDQLNNGCDLLAGTAALQCGAQQAHCTYYFTNAGRPLLGDVFIEAGQVADRVQLAHLLSHQRHKPMRERAHYTHIARLAESGEIDGHHDMNLGTTRMRRPNTSCLGNT